MNILSQLESLLFVAGEDGLRLEEVMELLGLYPNQARYQLSRLQAKYRSDAASGLVLLQVGDRYQLSTAACNQELLEKYACSPYATKLSQAALETLAIVAYRQPVTRIEIDEIRGVQSLGMLQKLLRFDLIEELGRQEGPGRPILYGVSAYFYRYFGLQSLADLPEINFLELLEEEDKAHPLFSKEE